MWQHMFCVSVMCAVWRQLNEEINVEIPDDGLKGSKYIGLFKKNVLSDFSVT